MGIHPKRPGSAMGRAMTRKRSRSSSSCSSSSSSKEALIAFNLSRLQELHRATRQETKSRHAEQLRALRERSASVITQVERTRSRLSDRIHAEKLALDAGLSRHECNTNCRTCEADRHSEPQGAVWSRRCSDTTPLHICHAYASAACAIECKRLTAKAKLCKKSTIVALDSQESKEMNDFTIRANELKVRQEAELLALTGSQQSELNLACISVGQLLFVCGDCSTHFPSESPQAERQETALDEPPLCSQCRRLSSSTNHQTHDDT